MESLFPKNKSVTLFLRSIDAGTIDVNPVTAVDDVERRHQARLKDRELGVFVAIIPYAGAHV